MGTRLKDFDWRPGDDHGAAPTWERVQVAVLLDIRDELKRLNTLLHCGNFTGMPTTLRKIERRLALRIPLRKAKK